MKHFYKKILYAILSAVLMSSCVFKNSKVSISAPKRAMGLVSVARVEIVNNQLIVTGKNLDNVKNVKVEGNNVNENFSIESLSSSRIVANASRAFSFGVNGVFNLILSDATAAATFAVSFTLQDGSVTADHLSSMGAAAGQVLKYNGTNWVPSSLIDGQTYMGMWDASTATLPALSNPGDYFIVSVAGTFGTPAISYAAGDWIITDGYNWQKVGYSNSVSSFQGRKGIVTLQPSDYVSLKDTVTSKITGSSLNDIADVALVNPANGSVLKFDGTNWVVGVDNIGVNPGGIVDGDISGTAAIAQSKIANLTTDLAGKQATLTNSAGLAGALTDETGTDKVVFSAGPALTGVPTSTTAALNTNTTQIATTAFVMGQAGILSPLAGSTSITTVGTIGTGTWQGTIVGMPYGGTGANIPSTPGGIIYSKDATTMGVTAAGTSGQFLKSNAAAAPAWSDIRLADLKNAVLGPLFPNDCTASQIFNYSVLQDKYICADLPASATSWETATGGINYAGGSVGIGTSAPSGSLSVTPAQYSTGTASQSTTTVTGSGTTWTSAMVGSQFVFANGVSAGTITAVTDATTLTVSTSQTIADQAYKIGYTGLQVASNGNVGIGTTAPTTNLDINGGFKSYYVGTSGTTAIYDSFWSVGGGQFAAVLRMQNETAETVRINTQGDSYFNGGNVGIGTPTPDANYKLDVNGKINGTEVCIAGTCKSAWSALITDVFASLLAAPDTTGLTHANHAIAAGDSLTIAFNKLRFTQGDYLSKTATNTVNGTLAVNTLTGDLTVPYAPAGVNSAVNQQYVLDLLNSSGAKTATSTGSSVSNTSTSSTGSIAKVGLNIQSTGTWDGASATNTGLNVNVSGGTTNYAATFTGGNVGIGTAAPVTPLHIWQTGAGLAPSLTADNGVATFATATTPELQIGGYPTTPYAVWLQVKRSLNDGNTYPLSIQPLGGNVGIGTTAPVAVLEIHNNDEAGYMTSLADVTTKSALKVRPHNSDTSALYFGQASGAVQTLQSANGTGVTYYPIALNPYGGNVGIGTTGPSSKLDIQGTSGTPATLLNLGGTGAGHNQIAISNTGGALGLGVSRNDGLAPFTTGSGYASYLTTTNATNLVLGTNNTANVTVQSGGNVGIGTATPESALEILSTTNGVGSQLTLNRKAVMANQAGVGTINFAGGNNASDIAKIVYAEIMGVSEVSTSGSEAGGLAFYTLTAGTNSEKMRITSSGHVGIGISSIANFGSGRGVQISGAGNQASSILLQNTTTGNAGTDGLLLQMGIDNITGYLWNYENGATVLGTNNTEYMRITSAGNVGMGTTNPGSGTKLKVAGQIATTSGSISTGSVDFSLGNAITTSFDCGTNISFANLVDGGSYSLVVTGTGTTQCNFATATTGDDANTVSYRFKPANADRTATSHTVYSLMRVGTVVYISWISGF